MADIPRLRIPIPNAPYARVCGETRRASVVPAAGAEVVSFIVVIVLDLVGKDRSNSI
jgi:hypothetical protein